ncbi:MAG: hypothetical protein R6V50_00495 [Thermoplasmatota archaeon]
MEKNKMLSLLIVSLLVLSTGFVVYNTVDTVKAGYITEPESTTPVDWILSNDGFGSQALNLTCGETLTFQIVNNSLTYNARFKMGVWNGTGWVPLKTSGSTDRADRFGNLAIDFHVPGWHELEANPVTENGTGLDDSAGQWNITLLKYADNTQMFDDVNITIQIGNQYAVEFYAGGSQVDSLLYNKYYSDFYVKIFNWTGTSLTLATGDTTKYKFDVTMHNYTTDAGVFPYVLGTERTQGRTTEKEVWIDEDIVISDDKEKNFWINVTHSDDPTLSSWIPLPLLLDITLPSPPSEIVWGDTLTVAGAVLDGDEEGMKSYTVRLYCPIDGGYYLADSDTTSGMTTTGSYSISGLETGSGEGFGAGTWYVGTFMTGTGRPDMSHQPPYVAGFIPYHTFTLDTKDTATVNIVTTDDITTGFESTINVTVRNESWMDNDEYKNMNIHITGVEVTYDGIEYRAGDIVHVEDTPSKFTKTLAYYEFDVTFEKTGTFTVWASWDGNLTSTWNTDDVNGETGTYSAKYRNNDLKANITGKVTASVLSPAAMNLRIPSLTDEDLRVQIKDACGGKQNETVSATRIHVFGDAADTYMNASITVSGCGLDFTIDESKTEAGTGKGSTYLENFDFDEDGNGSYYDVFIGPKTGGTLTITATNVTTGRSVSRDYTVVGLTGSVTTSVGDDLEITVGTTETVTVSGVNNFAMIYLTYFDEDWVCKGLLNVTDPDEPTMSFIPDEDDIDQVGYIVVIASMGATFNQHMYDIIEVVPVDDLTIEIIEPDVANQTLTVGIENELMVELRDPDGELVDQDNPGIVVKLVDEDNDEDDPLQEWTYSGSGEFEFSITPWFPGQLIIEGYNASDAIKHIGRTELDVEYATVTFSPMGTTAGIGLENLTVEVFAVDANGNPITDTLYLWDTEEEDWFTPNSVSLTDGEGEFDISEVGDNKTTIVGVWDQNDPEDGNATDGEFDIAYPVFTLNPDTVYLNQENLVEVTTQDAEGEPIEGIYLTFWGFATNPDPVRTDEEGFASFSITPLASGKYNVSIIKELIWTGNRLDWDEMWDEAVITDTVLTATSFRFMDISAPASVNEEAQFTVTITRKGTTSPVVGALATFAAETKTTGADGKVTFTAPSVTAHLTYHITATATGYLDATATILVINLPKIYLSAPDEIAGGETFEVVAGADDGNNAGIRVTFDGETKITSATGTVKFTAPSVTENTVYTITATKEGYMDADPAELSVISAGIPGFEVLTLIAALGVAFILLKKRKRN